MDISKAFKFCPRCGAEAKVSKRMMSCPSCGLDTYFSPKPVQEVVLQNKAGEYLFCVRAADPEAGRLDFPGGFVEPGETFEESLRREVKEELGIEININDLEYLHSDYTTYLFQGVNYNVVGTSFYAELPEGVEIKPADDVAGVEFYKLHDIPMDRLAWSTSGKIIKILAERENSKPS